MDMYQNPYMGLSGISSEEMTFLQQATATLTDDQKRFFFMIYSGKRRSPQDMLIFCLVGLCLVPGLQRFMVGQIGMGILYLFTVGFCFIGSIVDLVNHKTLSLEYNQKMAFEAYNLAKMGN